MQVQNNDHAVLPFNHAVLVMPKWNKGVRTNEYRVRGNCEMGGHDIAYGTADGGTLCGTCVGDEIELVCTDWDTQWYVTHHYLPSEPVSCCHCHSVLEP